MPAIVIPAQTGIQTFGVVGSHTCFVIVIPAQAGIQTVA